MMCAEILLCGQLAFTIDRVEGDFTIVEWHQSEALTDVSSELFPSLPKEGEAWDVRILQCHLGTSTHERLDNTLRNPSGNRLYLPPSCKPEIHPLNPGAFILKITPREDMDHNSSRKRMDAPFQNQTVLPCGS